MTDEEKSRLEELTKKCLKQDGQPRSNANEDELTELAVLQGKAEADGQQGENPEQPNPNTPLEENEGSEGDTETPNDDSNGTEPEEGPKPEPEMDLTGIPGIAHRHVKAGCVYHGVDAEGNHILHNEIGYHRIASDGIQLDLLGDGLPEEYLASLKK